MTAEEARGAMAAAASASHHLEDSSNPATIRAQQQAHLRARFPRAAGPVL